MTFKNLYGSIIKQRATLKYKIPTPPNQMLSGAPIQYSPQWNMQKWKYLLITRFDPPIFGGGGNYV